MTVMFEHILKFTTGAEIEPLLGLKIVPSIIFVESGPGKFLQFLSSIKFQST